MRLLINKDVMVVDIGDVYIKLVLSKGKKIIKADKIKTPIGAVLNNSVQDSLAIAEEIDNYRQENSVHVNNVIFVIKGQDVVVRHVEVPIMKIKEIEESAKWEISQSLPEQGNDYYIDFEIVDKIENDDKKVYKLLVVAAPKEKIDKYVELSEKLNLKLLAIDSAANCISRVFSNVYEKNKSEENIGIIEIGEKESNIIILDKGKLFIERELLFGTSNITNQLKIKLAITEDAAENYLKEKISLINFNENDEGEARIRRLFDNVFSSFEKVIQFFYTGRAKRNLDKIYVIGNGTEIKDIKEYINNYLGTDVELINNNFNIPMKLEDNVEIKSHLPLFGALLRNKKRSELNMIPYDLKNRRSTLEKNNSILAIAGVIISVLLIVTISINLCVYKLQSDNQQLKQEITEDGKVISENVKLNNEKQTYLKQINLVDGLQKNKVYYSEWFKELVNQLPPNVSINTISKDKDQNTLNIQGEAKDILSIPKYSVNLQNSGKFTYVKIENITQDTSGTSTFSISVREVVKK